MNREKKQVTCCPKEPVEIDLRPVEGPEADNELANLTKALGNPIRIQIIRLLSRENSCVCGKIVDQLPIAQSTVSQHLKVLKEDGLIRGDIEGASTCYCVHSKGLKRLKVLISGL